MITGDTLLNVLTVKKVFAFWIYFFPACMILVTML